MKKLMIAAAIVCAAVVGQAASLKWTLSDFTAKETSATTGYKVFIMIASDSSGDYTSKALSVSAASELAANGDFDTLASKAITTANLDKDGAVSTPYSTSTNWKKNTEIESYAIIINSEDSANATYYTIGLDTDNDPATTYYTKFSTDSKQTGATLQQAADWSAVSAVPEPTSGLLLLLGVAGLALRRRRA